MSDDTEWPREIWMADRDNHDQGVADVVLSEHATIPRYEGDTERDREFHRYVDGDIFESAERYHKARLETLTAERDALKAECAALADKGED